MSTLIRRIRKLKIIREDAKKIRTDFAKIDDMSLTCVEKDDIKFFLVSQYNVISQDYIDTKFWYQHCLPSIIGPA